MTTRQQTLRVLAVGVIALALGALDSLIKGDGSGLVGALSQTAAPWFLLAFLAGAATSDRRIVLSAFAGFGATILALIGFYFVNSLIFRFGSVSWLSSFHYSLGAGKVYFELALFSGPFFGAFGAWWKKNLSMAPVIALGLLFVIEALGRATQSNIFVQYADPVAAIEVLVGLLWTVLAFCTTRMLRQRANFQKVR
jgi:Family of unknown function (DUF6518)